MGRLLLLLLLLLIRDASCFCFSPAVMAIKPVESIKGRVAIVTGASRGIGKGIALTLGERGCIVYVTGRSSMGIITESVGGSLEETVGEINAAGGTAIAVPCDHGSDLEVKALFMKVDREQGRLDILVNNAFDLGPKIDLNRKFWEQGVEGWDAMHRVGLRSAYTASCEAVPRMMKCIGKGTRPGLIVNISSFGGIFYIFNVAYGVGKAALDRLTSDMSAELKELNIATVSMWPGVVMTEKMTKILKDGKWDNVVGSPVEWAESPRLVGRAIAALAGDPEVMKRSGDVVVVAELAKEYGFTDINGKIPPSIRSLRYLLGGYGLPKLLPKSASGKTKIDLASAIPDILIPWNVLRSNKAQAPPPEQS